MPISAPVLSLLRILKDYPMPRPEALRLFGGTPAAFEAAVMDAGGMVRKGDRSLGGGPTLPYLWLTETGEQALRTQKQA